MVEVTAAKELRYGGKTYVAGDQIEMPDKDANLLSRIGRVAIAPPPIKTDLPASVAEDAPDERTALRAEYQERLGKRPCHGWSSDELRERLGEYQRRDMRAED
jgi:hypothetical protein